MRTVEFPCSEGKCLAQCQKVGLHLFLPCVVLQEGDKDRRQAASGPSLWSDSTSNGEEKLGYIGQPKAKPSGHPHIAEAF